MDQAEKLRTIFKDRTQFAKTTKCRVIAVSSGKGGVGKTNFTVNLAVLFSKLNKRVVIIDADFGLANIEVLFGVAPEYSIHEVLTGTKSIADVLAQGPMNIQFISGGAGIHELSKINDMQMKNLIDNFAYLDSFADIILVDTGAGITNTVINFIKASSEAVIITTPEPTAITDAYVLIKALKADSLHVLPDIKVVVNKIEDKHEGEEVFLKLNNVTEQFLDVKIQSLGDIPYDPFLVKAVKRQEPATICFPNCNFSRSVEEIALRLLNITEDYKSSHSGISYFIRKLINIFKG